MTNSLTTLLNLKLLEGPRWTHRLNLIDVSYGSGKEGEMHQDRKTYAVACELASADHQNRLTWIKELNAAALRDYRRLGSRIELTYAPSAAVRVREFVRREQECCPFIDFTIQSAEKAVILVIEAPQSAGEVADALFAPTPQQGLRARPRS
ncbi:hypothetical protein [Mycobacterium haemophilum]